MTQQFSTVLEMLFAQTVLSDCAVQIHYFSQITCRLSRCLGFNPRVCVLEFSCTLYMLLVLSSFCVRTIERVICVNLKCKKVHSFWPNLLLFVAKFFSFVCFQGPNPEKTTTASSGGGGSAVEAKPSGWASTTSGSGASKWKDINWQALELHWFGRLSHCFWSLIWDGIFLKKVVKRN